MKITITLDDKYQSAIDRRTTEAETVEGIASKIVSDRFDAFLAIDEDDAKEALAQSETLLAVGKRVAAATPEKQAEAIAAAIKVLDS